MSNICLLNLPTTTEEVGIPVVMLDMCGVRRELRVLREVLFELKRLGPGRGVLRDPDQRKKWTYCCQDNCSVFLAEYHPALLWFFVITKALSYSSQNNFFFPDFSRLGHLLFLLFPS